jgi:hypothetical protein
MKEDKMDEKTAVGRTVLFVSDTGAHLAAIVTKVWSDEMVNLNVQIPGDGNDGNSDAPPVVRMTSIPFNADAATKRTWHWPTIVKPAHAAAKKTAKR